MTEPARKLKIDELLLALPGVTTRKLNGLDAYFVGDRMFACIEGNGIGLRLPVATATELQFSRANIVPFKPGGTVVSREWVQIQCEDASEFALDQNLFQASLEFVKAAPRR
ncbi:MAG: hypothetical protein O3A06_04490 [Proteobacteria bacterium]|nr:hypothetical protein [Pseudomonadota bacterium]MDA0982293.1 hypothetical protein [Pseudomonadota bacterium]